ncbi:MAG TPA: FAD/NAD(P)-binding protein, partial [Longimicrobiales bacterium]|nr:FAD/NAD(P)-binding protein [Longimicrobiales bacterium]
MDDGGDRRTGAGMRSLDTDYLVVGAGAMGMAFADALVDHADVHVTLVDRRTAPGGHWRDAYAFVQLHQASVFYGVASTVMGDGTIQTSGPETGLHERAGLDDILDYFDRVMTHLRGTGRVDFVPQVEHRHDGDGHELVSTVTGETTAVRVRRRVVDAAYLAPTIPATTPAPFAVADDARVLPVNDLD